MKISSRGDKEPVGGEAGSYKRGATTCTGGGGKVADGSAVTVGWRVLCGNGSWWGRRGGSERKKTIIGREKGESLGEKGRGGNWLLCGEKRKKVGVCEGGRSGKKKHIDGISPAELGGAVGGGGGCEGRGGGG